MQLALASFFIFLLFFLSSLNLLSKFLLDFFDVLFSKIQIENSYILQPGYFVILQFLVTFLLSLGLLAFFKNLNYCQNIDFNEFSICLSSRGFSRFNKLIFTIFAIFIFSSTFYSLELSLFSSYFSTVSFTTTILELASILIIILLVLFFNFFIFNIEKQIHISETKIIISWIFLYTPKFSKKFTKEDFYLSKDKKNIKLIRERKFQFEKIPGFSNTASHSRVSITISNFKSKDFDKTKKIVHSFQQFNFPVDNSLKTLFSVH
jgi:hypothetical protein